MQRRGLTSLAAQGVAAERTDLRPPQVQRAALRSPPENSTAWPCEASRTRDLERHTSHATRHEASGNPLFDPHGATRLRRLAEAMPAQKRSRANQHRGKTAENNACVVGLEACVFPNNDTSREAFLHLALPRFLANPCLSERKNKGRSTPSALQPSEPAASRHFGPPRITKAASNERNAFRADNRLSAMSRNRHSPT